MARIASPLRLALNEPTTCPEVDCSDDCTTCQGFGNVTLCPLCRGDGCWDCEDGMVAGP